jgi:hypothetical protein
MKFIDRVDGFAKKVERFVAGSAVNDPLYVTNRTFGQRVRIGLLVGTPILAVGGLIYLALSQQFDRPIVTERNAAKAAADLKPKEPTGEITAKVLPNLDKDFASEQSRDVEVVEASITRSGERVLAGKVRNNSDQIVRVADLVFDVTDKEGSQLGGVSVRVENIPARSTVPFRLALEQHDAQTALVREVRSR